MILYDTHEELCAIRREWVPFFNGLSNEQAGSLIESICNYAAAIVNQASEEEREREELYITDPVVMGAFQMLKGDIKKELSLAES